MIDRTTIPPALSRWWFMSRKSQLKTEIFSKAEGNPLLRGIAGMAMESVQPR